VPVRAGAHGHGASNCGHAFKLFIVHEGTFSAASRDPSILGATLSDADRPQAGFVSYERTIRFSKAIGIAPGRLLGYVLAHEIGHLLLPRGGHARSGIMREPWGPSELRQLSMGTLLFSAEYGSALRAELVRSTSRPRGGS
jgi:hypothetical protein